MIVIVDANIIITAIINPYGTIASLLSAAPAEIELITPQFAISEVKKHSKRICEKGKISTATFSNLLNNILRHIIIFGDEEIMLSDIDKARNITKDIDTNDTLYIAFAITLNALIWTGDLKLHNALHRKKIYLTITTQQLLSIIKGL